MNQKLIGEFIASKRKKKNLTQKELADKLNLSEKTISKWETGNGLPELSNMQPLCEELDITVTELLNGKESNNKDSGVIKYIEIKDKKNKKKLFITILLSTLLVLISILGTYFYNNFNKVIIYELSGSTDHFIYKDGLVLKSNMKQLLVTGEVEIVDNYVKPEDIRMISIYSGNTIIIGHSANNFSTSLLEDYGYGEIFTEEKLNNIDNWYILVEYIKNDKYLEEKIPIKNKISLRNNKLLYKKTKPISVEENGYDALELRRATALEELLLKNNYEFDYRNTYTKELEKGTMTAFVNGYLMNISYITKEYNVKIDPYAQYYSIHNLEKEETIYYYRKNNVTTCYENEIKKECPEHIDEKIKEYIKVTDHEFGPIIPPEDQWYEYK